MLRPARPRTSSSGAASRRRAISWRRGLRRAAQHVTVGAPGGQLPAQARGQPADQQHRRDRRVGMVADRDRGDRLELRAQRRRVEGGRDPLAPWGGPQPGEIDDVEAVRQGVGAVDRLVPDGLVDGVEQRRLRERQQRLDGLGMAVGRPQQGRQVAHHERVGDRQQVVQVAIAELDDHGLVQQHELSRAWPRLRRRRLRARPGACAWGRRRARSGARRGSGRRRAGGWRSPRSIRSRRRPPC